MVFLHINLTEFERFRSGAFSFVIIWSKEP